MVQENPQNLIFPSKLEEIFKHQHFFNNLSHLLTLVKIFLDFKVSVLAGVEKELVYLFFYVGFYFNFNVLELKLYINIILPNQIHQLLTPFLRCKMFLVKYFSEGTRVFFYYVLKSSHLFMLEFLF